jgi:hypothetical protein
MYFELSQQNNSKSKEIWLKFMYNLWNDELISCSSWVNWNIKITFLK